MALPASIPRVVLVPGLWEHYEKIALAVKNAVRGMRRPELEDDVLGNVLERAVRNPLDSSRGSVKAWVRKMVKLSVIDVVVRRASSQREWYTDSISEGWPHGWTDGEARAMAHVQLGEFERRFPRLSAREQHEVREKVGAVPKPVRKGRKRRDAAGHRQPWLAWLLVAAVLLYMWLAKRAP